MNEILSKIRIWKESLVSIFHAHLMNENWLRLEMCVSYAYHMNEMPRRVWLWKEITLYAHHMSRVSCIVQIECQEVIFMKKKVSVLSLIACLSVWLLVSQEVW